MHLFNHIQHFTSLDSTNRYVKEHIDSLENHAVISCSYQTDGRGQFERTWESLPELNLLFSILFKEEISAQLVSDYCVESILETLENFQIHAAFKMPNDILIDGKKISGILIETKYLEGIQTSLILGIGLNVNQTKFENENAISMSLISGSSYDLSEVLNRFLEILERKLL